MGSVPNCQKEIPNRHAIRWFKCKLKPPKKWGKYFLPPSKQQKDPDTSSVFSYNSNATEASTNQKQQVISYKPNIPQKKAIQRPPNTRYGADIPKEILDNIPAFEGKQGELSQFLNTIESYSMMYRVCKTDLVLLRFRGKSTQDHHTSNSRRPRCGMVRHQEKTHEQLWIHKKQDQGKCENLKTIYVM